MDSLPREPELLQVSLPHQDTRLRSASPGALPAGGRARAPIYAPLGTPQAVARPHMDRPEGMRRDPRRCRSAPRV